MKIKIIRKYGKFEVGQIVDVDQKTSQYMFMNAIACIHVDKKSECSDDCDECDDCGGKKKKSVETATKIEMESTPDQQSKPKTTRKRTTTKKPDHKS